MPETDTSTLARTSQDEMNEIHEREEQAATEAQAASTKKTHDDLMREANLDGVESLADDMVRFAMCCCLF